MGAFLQEQSEKQTDIFCYTFKFNAVEMYSQL